MIDSAGFSRWEWDEEGEKVYNSALSQLYSEVEDYIKKSIHDGRDYSTIHKELPALVGKLTEDMIIKKNWGVYDRSEFRSDTDNFLHNCQNKLKWAKEMGLIHVKGEKP